MNTNYLLPRKFRTIGWIMFPFFFAGSIYCISGGGTDLWNIPTLAIITDGFSSNYSFFEIMENPIFDELSSIGLIISLLFISFSREKYEDEYVQHIRLKSMAWSVIISYIVFILGTLFIYDFVYFTFLLVNAHLLLFIFTIKFNWELYKFRKQENE